ncbi:hypothetical protein FACS189419_05260 [Planctomycetales bacterium]|nr:hypothetical protein FACS189419_05260 [Planctomycetales bacterium]
MLRAALDGKTAKQSFGENGEPEILKHFPRLGAVSVLRLLMGADKVIVKAKAEDIHDAPKRFLKKTRIQMTL